MMRIGNALVAVALAGLVALPLAGCASGGKKLRLYSQKMCEAAGGTYTSKTCNLGAANQKTAAQMCQAHGGAYFPVEDFCEIEP